MIDPLPLIFLSIALVPGTADSVPSTEGMTFKVHIEPDVVDAFNYRNSGGFTVHFKPSISNQTVTLGLPIGLPMRGDWGGYHYLEPVCAFTMGEFPGATRVDDTEFQSCAILHRSYAIGSCHTFISITVNNSVPIDFIMLELADSEYAASISSQSGLVAPQLEPRLEWLGAPETPPEPDSSMIVSHPVPDGCGHVLVWPPFDPPLSQVRGDGVLAGSVACNDGLVLRLREAAGGHKPLCILPETADELVRRGVLEDDRPAPRGHRVRP